MRVRWLKKAIGNLDAEADYVARENSAAAAEMFVYFPYSPKITKGMVKVPSLSGQSRDFERLTDKEAADYGAALDTTENTRR